MDGELIERSSCISCTDQDSVVVLTNAAIAAELASFSSGEEDARGGATAAKRPLPRLDDVLDARRGIDRREESDRPAAGERRRWTQRELVLACCAPPSR